MQHELYTWEKLRELEREARARKPGRPRATGGPMLGAGLVRATGRLLRRLGAGLEGWGEPQSAPSGCCETCG